MLKPHAVMVIYGQHYPFPPRCDGKRQPTYRKGKRGDIDL